MFGKCVNMTQSTVLSSRSATTLSWSSAVARSTARCALFPDRDNQRKSKLSIGTGNAFSFPSIIEPRLEAWRPGWNEGLRESFETLTAKNVSKRITLCTLVEAETRRSMELGDELNERKGARSPSNRLSQGIRFTDYHAYILETNTEYVR